MSRCLQWKVGENSGRAGFLTNSPATQHIDALEDSEVLSLEKRDLESLYEKVPKFERFFRILLQHAFVANQQRILGSISQTAEELYVNFITKYPSFEQRRSSSTNRLLPGNYSRNFEPREKAKDVGKIRL